MKWAPESKNEPRDAYPEFLDGTLDREVPLVDNAYTFSIQSLEPIMERPSPI